MSKIKNCPCCNHHDMYEIKQTDDMGAEIPALFCNACKMIFTVENDSPYMSDEKTFEYLKEKLHEKFNKRTIIERILTRLKEERLYPLRDRDNHFAIREDNVIRIIEEEGGIE